MSTINEKILNVYTGYQTVFQKAYAAEGREDISAVALKVDSKTAAEQYPALVGVPQMKKFKDEAEIQELSASSFTVVNEEFEATISIPLAAYQDDALGMYDAKITEMAENAKSHPWQLFISLLDGAFTKKDYTGKAFIAANKPYIPGVDGLANPTFSNKGTKKLTAESLEAALAEFKELKDPYGNSVFVGSTKKLTLIVPSALEMAAKRLIEKDGNNENALYGACELRVVAGLQNQQCWFLADLNSSIKPFIYQDRIAPMLYSNSSAMAAGKEDFEFMRKHRIYFQVTSRGALTYGASSRIWGSDGSDDGDGSAA